MADNKVWLVKHAAGNWRIPGFGKHVYTNGPYRKGVALADAAAIDSRWRVWVEHSVTGKRIFESAGEMEFKAEAGA